MPIGDEAQTIFDRLKEAEGKLFFNDEGAQTALSVMQPLTPEQTSDCEKELGFPLPDLLSDLVKLSSGVEGLLSSIDFSGQYGFEFDLLPSGVPIAADLNGNFWVLQDSAVYYASHDPPVLLWQAESLTAFLDTAIEGAAHNAHGTISVKASEMASKIWKDNPGAITFEKATSADAQLSNFALTLDQSYEFVDLRKASSGDGLSWGRYGNTPCKRFADAPIFAYQKRKLSWIQKVFGV